MKSLEEIAEAVWKKAYTLGYEGNEPTGHDLAHTVLDFMPKYLDKWMDNRLSVADSLKYTPEKVEAILRAIHIKLIRDLK